MKTRMEHILEIVKELCRNESMCSPGANQEFRAGVMVELAYHLYNKIEDKEEQIRMDARVGF